MIISLIAAVDEGGGIGFQGRIPWHLSSDLRRFKTLTMGHFLIMGRKTCESIRQALPGRTSIVVTRNRSFGKEGFLIAPSLEEAIRIAQQAQETEVFVIGGGEIYSQALPLAHRLYMTRVHVYLKADTFFPSVNEQDWRVIDREDVPAGDKDEYPSTFCFFEKVDTLR